MSKPDRLQLLESIPADDIQALVTKGVTPASIPESLVEYILQMNSMIQILNYNRNSYTRAVEALRKRWPTLTVTQARNIYRDALEYYYVDPEVSARALDLKYADAMDDLARVAIAADKYATAQRALEKAHELRTMQREREEFNWTPPIIIYNINIRPEDLGYESQKLADIARRAEDRKFKAMIEGLETTEAEKIRLLNEAGIRTVEPIEDQDEHDADILAD
jgi:hypothetical protein